MLETDLVGIRLHNPTVLASGILGVNAKMLIRVANAGAGAVTTKSIGPKENPGHKNPTVIGLEHGLLNAVGLSTAGYQNMEEEWTELKKLKVPLIASIYGKSVEDFKKVTESVVSRKPAIIELNISCPNVKGQIPGCNPEATYEIVSAVKDVSAGIPVMPKLTPNTHLIVEVAKSCEEAGADAIAAINTISAMAINIEAKKPVLAFKKGGYSGRAIKPVAVRCVYDIYENVKIPILGIGGITNGEDAIEMIEAGASAIGLGSAVYESGIDIFKNVCSEMKEWMKENRVKKVRGLIGVAHE